MKKLSSFLNFMIFTLVVIIGGAFFFLNSRSEQKSSLPQVSPEQIDEIVNRNLKKTILNTLRTKITNEKSILENQKQLNEFVRLKRIKEDSDNAKIPLERQLRQENVKTENSTAARVAGENGRESTGGYASEYFQQDKMNEAEKKEYAKQWILNARKEGYLLELSSDLEVIKYTPIRKPSQQDDSTESFPSD